MPVKTLLPIQDVYISQYYANQNFASSPYLYFGQYKNVGDSYRALLQFSLHNLPSYRRIELAQLQFTVYRNEYPTGTIINASLERPLGPWNASTVTWNTQPSTRLVYTFLSSYADTPGTLVSNDITNLVKSWLDGSKPNYGLLLVGDESIPSLLGLYSSEFRNFHFDNLFPRPHGGFSLGFEPHRFYRHPKRKHSFKHKKHPYRNLHNMFNHGWDHVPYCYTGPKLVITYC